jgi:hypothetical protein
MDPVHRAGPLHASALRHAYVSAVPAVGSAADGADQPQPRSSEPPLHARLVCRPIRCGRSGSRPGPSQTRRCRSTEPLAGFFLKRPPIFLVSQPGPSTYRNPFS